MRSSKFNYLFFIAALLLLFSCKGNKTGNKDRKAAVEAALKTYDSLILKMNFNAIAMMYTPDGELVEMAHGRDSIRKFLSGFSNVKVLAASSSSDAVEITADTAVQRGRYYQEALVDNADVIKPTGSYVATWVWTKKGGWKIRRMVTIPDQKQ